LFVGGMPTLGGPVRGWARAASGLGTRNGACRGAGLEVRYAQNVTDIDDPLLERATRDGEDWTALAERETERFRGDMVALRVLPPDWYVGAVEAMDEIAATVVTLRDRGLTYDLDGDVYFPVAAAPAFGEVSRLSRDEMTALFRERGGDPDRPGKKDPLDALLWLAARPGEPAWDSPLGRGRPGWHVECAAIALGRLGEQIDVQGGGSDLVFPHHEHSAVEAEAVTGAHPFARAYVHAGMVGLDGAKMSKSLGNLVFVSQLRSDGVDPGALRLALLASHYRSDREWTSDELARGADRLMSWSTAVSRSSGPSGEALLAYVRAALANDLDTPAALELVDAWSAADGDDTSAPALVRDLVDALLGVALP
jgi:L-cysteine:1D-myo-inositol 2-amino-2-deoxy-alpha-D-glucopyranoside ligase